MLHSPADQAWNDYWVANCEIWYSAEPLCWQASLVTGINQVRGVERKGTIIQMPSIFRQGGRWMVKRWDGDENLFIPRQGGIDTGRKGGEVRLEERKRGKEQRREKERRGRHEGGVQRLNDHLHSSLVRKNNLGNLVAAQEKLSIYLALYKLH